MMLEIAGVLRKKMLFDAAVTDQSAASYAI